MTNNNHTSNLPCAFGETLIAVLYGEATPAEKNLFSAHAADCAVCQDELAAFGEIKTAIGFWRAADFAPLETPAIAAAFPQQQDLVSEKNENISWLESLRAIFLPTKFGWQTAAAFSLFAVFAAFVFAFALWSGKQSDNKNVALVAVTPARQTASPGKLLAAPDVAPTPVAKSNDAPDVAVERESKRENRRSVAAPTPFKKVVKTSVAQTQPPRPVYKESVRRAPNQTQTAVELSEFPDDADDSLRLLELLEEIEPSK